MNSVISGEIALFCEYLKSLFNFQKIVSIKSSSFNIQSKSSDSMNEEMVNPNDNLSLALHSLLLEFREEIQNNNSKRNNNDNDSSFQKIKKNNQNMIITKSSILRMIFV
jgi:hypothetical protein